MLAYVSYFPAFVNTFWPEQPADEKTEKFESFLSYLRGNDVYPLVYPLKSALHILFPFKFGLIFLQS